MDTKLQLLSEKKNKLDLFKPLPDEIINNLEDWFRVELTYSSNAIEGNTLTRIETAEIIEKGISATISGQSLKDQLEAVNHAKALEYIKQLGIELRGHQFITENHIRQIHQIILTGIEDKWAGKYRQTRVMIRGTDLELPEGFQVPDLMHEFAAWLQDQQEEHPVKIAAEAHLKFETIHPFIDGNGRVGRLLMNLILVLNGFPMAIIKNEERTAYLKALNIAQTQQDNTFLYQLFADAVERSLDIYLEATAPERESKIEPTPDQRFFTTDEVASLLQVDPESVRRYVRRGDLRAVKLGGKFIRIDKVDLDKFIEGLKK